ncbi:MAG TPA: hypothetical protein VGR73_04485 [Bryobacteraceae bacterium]|nr:hypothetical protein [Bryobacteraceae bacterium]
MHQPSTLIGATRQALDAAACGDLDALADALTARQAVLEDASVPERAAAVKEGESIRLLLVGIKRRIGDQHRHLDQIKTGLARTGEPNAAAIDLRA